MMHQSEFDAANVALSRAADKRKSLINIHKNRYTVTLSHSMAQEMTNDSSSSVHCIIQTTNFVPQES